LKSLKRLTVSRASVGSVGETALIKRFGKEAVIWKG
jgi:hypothetical protein